MTATAKSVCIIGAGIGGLTAGALLTKHGFKVTIYEKEHLLGGRALSIDDFTKISEKDYKKLLSQFYMRIAFSEPSLTEIFEKQMLTGYKLDLGYHAIGGGVFSNLNNVLAEFDMHVDFLESYVGFITKTGWQYPFLTRLDKLMILPNIIRLFLANEHTMQELDNVSMTETIKRYGKGKMTLILEIFSRSITTVNNLNRISTGEMFRAQKNLYRGSKPVGYPINGLNSIHSKLSSYILDHGGTIHLNTPVEKIVIENATTKGVKIHNQTHNYDIIISNVMVQELFSLIDENVLPKSYVTAIKQLEGTASLCAYYSLKTMDPALLGKTFHFIERDVGVDGNDAVGMIDFMATDRKAGLSPPDTYLIQSYIICTPQEAKDPQMVKQLRSLLDKNLEKLIPHYIEHLAWALYPVIWHLDGVAKTIQNDKPRIVTPIENLFIIGDCVKAPGIGVNCAINSARILTDKLTKP
ncbi:MAG: FAD-dependent oxidoreductase [Candidatus Thermoplasmatota archaeon]|nr:FAD-dependent oxidoreductase [Candidatus Thermoplasmatota archaeon]MBU1941835.1 FAD-dependent oxidoreductase [Candidatus Thermoplasmatota archaeon]